jgi:hypothetical protein
MGNGLLDEQELAHISRTKEGADLVSGADAEKYEEALVGELSG